MQRRRVNDDYIATWFSTSPSASPHRDSRNGAGAVSACLARGNCSSTSGQPSAPPREFRYPETLTVARGNHLCGRGRAVRIAILGTAASRPATAASKPSPRSFRRDWLPASMTSPSITRQRYPEPCYRGRPPALLPTSATVLRHPRPHLPFDAPSAGTTAPTPRSTATRPTRSLLGCHG